MSKQLIRVVLVRLDGLTQTFEEGKGHMAACRRAAEELVGLWASTCPIVKVFFAKLGDGPVRLEELDVDQLRTLARS